jgi:hypothetical protein
MLHTSIQFLEKENIFKPVDLDGRGCGNYSKIIINVVNDKNWDSSFNKQISSLCQEPEQSYHKWQKNSVTFFNWENANLW